MRFEIIADGVKVSEELRTYAESRIVLAIHRAAERLSFVGVRLYRDDEHAAARSLIQCQVEAWMRGMGVVTAKYADADTSVAIDRVASLLEHAVARRLREAESTEADEEELYAALTSD